MIPLLEIAQKKQLTANEQILLNYIANHPKKVIHQNLQFLCDQLYISNATIIRFCQKLGFRGFNEFKFELRNQFYEQEQTQRSHDTLFDLHLSTFKDYLYSIHLDKIAHICSMIQTHSTIYIYGSAMSSIPAHYLHSVLSSLDFPCIFVEWRHLLRGIAENTNQDTLMIMITSHGSINRYKDILTTLVNNQTDTVIITDEDNEFFLNHATVYINTDEAGKVMNNVDYSYKTQALITAQILIEMIYYQIANKQQ